MKRFAAFVLLMLVLGGCAIAPQQVSLSPTLTALSSVEGMNITVAVRVVDNRSSKMLGRIVGGNGGSVEVTSREEVATVVEKCLFEGLKKKGFHPVDFEEGITPQLTVEVNLLDYVALKGFPMWRAVIKGGLRAVVTRGKATFESTYQAEREEKAMSLPAAEKTEIWINSVLGEVVSNLLSDNRLLRFLVG
jgi:uncharacterized lipoprotein